MLASLHLAQHSAAGTARLLARWRRLRHELGRTPGLAAGHLFVTTELAAWRFGRPTPTRWALFCGFDDGEPAIEALERSAPMAALRDGARESWSVVLEPVRVTDGEWQGWRPETGGAAPFASDEPVAVITYGILRPRYAPIFVWRNAYAAAHAARQPGLLAQLGMIDRPFAASTFSLWRSHGEMVRFAYAPGDHKPVVRPSLDTPWGHSWFFARFRPLRRRGTWGGRDPLAAGTNSARASGSRDGAAGSVPVNVPR